MDFLLDILSDSRQVSARRMFGEYCLYYAGRPVGLVCDEQLFLKPTEAGLRLMKEPSEGTPFPGARPHLLITADSWDDRTWMNTLVRATFDNLPAPKLPRAKTAKPKATGLAGKAGQAAAIADLPNLGPQSQAMLAAAHIKTVAQLRKLGSVVAFARVKQKNAKASLNLLWALEGALTGLPWQVVAREHRTSLLLALEQQSLLPAVGKRTTRSDKH
jgi:DNA transformation protein